MEELEPKKITMTQAKSLFNENLNKTYSFKYSGDLFHDMKPSFVLETCDPVQYHKELFIYLDRINAEILN